MASDAHVAGGSGFCLSWGSLWHPPTPFPRALWSELEVVHDVFPKNRLIVCCWLCGSWVVSVAAEARVGCGADVDNIAVEVGVAKAEGPVVNEAAKSRLVQLCLQVRVVSIVEVGQSWQRSLELGGGIVLSGRVRGI